MKVLIALIDRVRMLDNDIIRLRSKLNTDTRTQREKQEARHRLINSVYEVTIFNPRIHLRSFPSLIDTRSSEMIHEFSNPSFSGNGYSTHVLSIEQLRYNRENQIKDDEKSAVEPSSKREEENTTINKFIKNVESRIYANLSKQLVDNMFGTTCTGECPTSGTAEVEGSTIYWIKDTTTEIITLTITDPNGTVTTMSVPLGDFQF